MSFLSRLGLSPLLSRLNRNLSYIPPASHRLHPSFSHPVLARYQTELSKFTVDNLVYPLFISQNDDTKEEISALPGQYRLGANRLDEMIEPLVRMGLKSVLLFGVMENVGKDNFGKCATSLNNPVARALKVLSKYPQLLLMCDVCLCAYTDHGHCGVLDCAGKLDNQASINRLAEISEFYVSHGCHVIAPSDMMDGRIGAIKDKLPSVPIFSYASKFQSCLYGPFRSAANSNPNFSDRSKYQLPVGSRSLALAAMKRDLEEGADMVMVKPGSFYLDIVRDVKSLTNVPVGIYQVSGEYSMIYSAAKAGAFDLKTGVYESLTCAKRAGADILISYFAKDVVQWLWEDKKCELKL